MNENRNSRLPTGLIWLLIYHCILALITLFFILRFVQLFIATGDNSFVLYILALACWGTVLVFASVGMVRRRPRAFLIGMICHLVLEIPGLSLMLIFELLWFKTSWSDSGAWVFDPFYLVFASMWLPFVLISGWAFFYLRRLRKSWFS